MIAAPVINGACNALFILKLQGIPTRPPLQNDTKSYPPERNRLPLVPKLPPIEMPLGTEESEMTNEEFTGGYEFGDLLLSVTAMLVTLVATWQFLL